MNTKQLAKLVAFAYRNGNRDNARAIYTEFCPGTSEIAFLKYMAYVIRCCPIN